MAVLAAALSLVLPSLGLAQKTPAKPKAKTETIDFRGTQVIPHTGVYLVLTDVNVRAKPMTKSKRVGRLKKGVRVDAVGRMKGPWLAVRGAGKLAGFVYTPTLMPLIDGLLSDPIKGTVGVGEAGTCAYVIEFLGKTKAENQRFEFADYGVEWDCRREGKRLRFHTPMFLTEGPHQGTQKPVHQITVDLLELEGGLEQIFSIHLLWDRIKTELKFDSVTMKKFARTKRPKPETAGKLRDALTGAVHMVTRVWNPAVWAAIAKKPENR